jgi:hypothetical protein
MAELFDQLKLKFQALAGSWAALSALGSFVLYVFGYLAVRFHLTTLGIGTDLAVLDERYLFTGAKFLVYLVSTIPILLLISIIISIPVLLIFGIARLIRNARQKRKEENSDDAETPPSRWQRIRAFLSDPRFVALLALLLSVAVIQFVMRQCYYFSNLLLATHLPSTNLNLHRLLFDEDGSLRSLYFSGLVAATMLTAALLHYARTKTTEKAVSKALLFLVAILVAVQFLLLPVNYGVFILEKQIPRVTDLGDQTPLKSGEEAWLVWEGAQGMTYLVLTNTGQASQPSRKLVTVPKKDFKRLEIIEYDEIISRLFNQ